MWRLAPIALAWAACAGPQPLPAAPQAGPERDRRGSGLPDRDGDRIADRDDLCPEEAEVYNGVDDDDGCPDVQCVVHQPAMHCDERPLLFARGGVVPDPDGRALLTQTIDAMAVARDDIERVSIEGFRSSDEPLHASLDRATAVQRILVEGGVDANRLAVIDGGLAPTSWTIEAQRRVTLAITKQRVSYESHGEIVCTPMGRWFRDAAHTARCR